MSIRPTTKLPHVFFAFFLLSASITAPATAQSTGMAVRKKAATEAFSMCREQAREGDATACWKVWVKKFKDVGTEAEVAYAEEHVGPPVVPAIARDVPPPGEEVKRVPPAASEREEGTVGDDTGEPEPEQDPSARDMQGGQSQANAAASGLPPVSGDVLDFCALKPRADAARFVKQRVIVFPPAGADAMDAEPALKAVEGPSLVKEVFAARFPLDRFHNVVPSFAGKPEWATAARLSLDEVRAFFTPAEAGGQTEADKQERDFVSYSLSCADYLAFPSIESHEATWEDREVQTKGGGKKKVKVLTLKLTGAIGIFKRDGNQFKLVQTIRSSVPGLMDFATDAAAGAIPDVDVNLGAAGLNIAISTVQPAIKLPPYISALPDASCALGVAGKDGVAGLSSCAKEGKASSMLAASAIEERASPVCREASSEKTPPARQKVAMVICEVRTRSAQLARALQKEARNVEGWKLFAPLQKGVAGDAEAEGMSLGKEEGIKVGYGFYALSPSRERLAYFKVTDIGPGGEAGIEDPTALNRRYGDAPVGARLEEYPQIGISLMPYGGGALLMTAGESRVDAPAGTSVYSLPTVVLGGGANVSYDLSGPLGMVETYLRIGAGYFTGYGASTLAALIPIDVVMEKGFYIGSPLTWFFAAGGGTTLVTVDVAGTAAGSEKQSLSASVYGGIGRTGLDIMLSPDATIRLDFFGRVNFTDAEYEDDEGNPAINGWEARKDKYAMVGATGAFGWTF